MGNLMEEAKIEWLNMHRLQFKMSFKCPPFNPLNEHPDSTYMYTPATFTIVKE